MSTGAWLILLFVALNVGVAFGILVVAICQAAKRGDEDE